MFLSGERSQHRILVVDDDPMIRELAATRLTLAGYETYQARDGAEAISRLGEVRPSAMILDINMPEVDGFGVLKYLRDNARIVKVRVMVLTARNQAADVKRAIEMGADDFLAKPFSDAQFLARTARLLRGLR